MTAAPPGLAAYGKDARRERPPSSTLPHQEAGGGRIPAFESENRCLRVTRAMAKEADVVEVEPEYTGRSGAGVPGSMATARLGLESGIGAAVARPSARYTGSAVPGREL